MSPFIQQLGFILFGGVFVWAGLEHFLRFRAIARQLGEQGFPAPAPLLAAGSLLEVSVAPVEWAHVRFEWRIGGR